MRDVKRAETRQFNQVKELLEMNGYELSDADIWDVVDYIDMQDENYTLFQWLRDTKMNCPRFLEIGSACYEEEI